MPDKLEKIKSEILKKIKPSDREERDVERFCIKLRAIISEFGYESVVVGSIGKYTWLHGDHDIDLFVLFPKSVSRQELEERGLAIGRMLADRFKTKPILKYAEHPYTQVHADSFDIDVVPCYKIEKGEGILSAVDRSPLHLEYVLENLKPEQRDDVRLLKQFMKGIRVYGSDVKHLGFSGYVAELLVIIFGSFEAVLQAASSWKIPQYIMTERDGHSSISRKKTPGCLFLMDSTDSSRNAAAAISPENLIKFKNEAANFLKNPSTDFFFHDIVPLSSTQIVQIKKRRSEFISLLAKRSDVIEDTLFPQLRKATKRFEKLFGANEFKVLQSIEYSDKKVMVMIFEFETCRLPDIKQMIGPVIYDRKHTQEFLSKYGKPLFGPFISEDKWVVEIPREFKVPQQLIKHFLSQPIEKLIESGIPKFVAPEIKQSKILDDKQTWSLIKKNKKLSDFVRRKYFEDFMI